MKNLPPSATRLIVFSDQKQFDLTIDVEGKEWWLSIVERSQNYFNKMAFSKKAASWLLTNISQAARFGKISQDSERDDFAFFLGQKFTNSGGTFIRISRHAKSVGGKVSFLCIPEGNEDDGWKSFAAALDELISSSTTLKSKSPIQIHKNLEIPVPQEPGKNRTHKNLNPQRHKNLDEFQIHKNLKRDLLSFDSKVMSLSCSTRQGKFVLGDWNCAMVVDANIRDPNWKDLEELIALTLEIKPIHLFPFEGSKAVWFADCAEDKQIICDQGNIELDIGWSITISAWCSATNTSIFVENGPSSVLFRGIPFHLRKPETLALLVKACGGLCFYPNPEILTSSLEDVPVVVSKGVANIPRFIPLRFEGSTIWIEVIISPVKFRSNSSEPLKPDSRQSQMESSGTDTWEKVGEKRTKKKSQGSAAVIKKGSGSLSARHIVQKENDPMDQRTMDPTRFEKESHLVTPKPQSHEKVQSKEEKVKKKKNKKKVQHRFPEVLSKGDHGHTWRPKANKSSISKNNSTLDASLELLEVCRTPPDDVSPHFDPLTLDQCYGALVLPGPDIKGNAIANGPLAVDVFYPEGLYVDLTIDNPPGEVDRLMSLGKQLGLSFDISNEEARALFSEDVDNQSIPEEDLDTLIDFSDLESLAAIHGKEKEEDEEVEVCSAYIGDKEEKETRVLSSPCHSIS